MGRHFKIVGVCALFLLVVSLPVSAGSINSFSNVKITGNSGSSVSGSFSFDSTTHVFSDISLWFSHGAFAGIQANGPQGQGFYVQGQGYLFSWLTTVNGNLVWDSIRFNPLTGQVHDHGGIANWQNQGGFNYLSVPEGGAELTYLMLTAVAVFGGILISSKQRRTTRSCQSG